MSEKRNWKWAARDKGSREFVDLFDTELPPRFEDGVFLGQEGSDYTMLTMPIRFFESLAGRVPEEGQCLEITQNLEVKGME